MGWQVIAFESELEADWKEVLAKATNATLMHQRSFLAYHKKRFHDASLILYRGDRPMAIFPAHREADQVFSHKGLGYAGLIHRPCSFDQEVQLYLQLLRYYEAQGVARLQIKATPSFYSKESTESLPYIMHLAQAEIRQMELSLAIKLPLKVRHKGRKANILQAKRSGLQVVEEGEVELFWDTLLRPNLKKRYQKKPTHNKEQMQYLKEWHPDNIRQFMVYQNGIPLAGATVFFTPNCLHTQYLATNVAGRKQHALDLLIDYLCTAQAAGRKYLDFGHSNECGGRKINRDLFRWKESFGAIPFHHSHYNLSTGAWRHLERVYQWKNDPMDA
ncbi:Acetyltransferase (GNAT) domain-containing protein [Cyclobacterium lianum]|uniref:Acetyltransferase (GNAT) domain-containing protein n=1 Tax=Cyclobacterium lianum TaxID=388280 RepID=A0A1M7QKX2_9BACT|nr:GNAT family N-acetyltransferase [Cyclobacterium lianum]SHN31851.1 Acetyltransferase (GNAT) domain-containing protein [Cyclobacterium lianum]